MPDPDALQPGAAQGHRQGVGDIGGGHGGAQLPGQDVAREVIEHGRQIEPAPADHPQVGKIGLPELIGCGGGMSEAVGRLNQDEGGTGDQVVRLQEPVNRGFRDEVLLAVDERDGQLPRRQLRLFECELEHRLSNRSGELVPYLPWRRGPILEVFIMAGSIAIVPAIKGGPWDAELSQGPPYRQRRLLDQPEDLQLLGGGVPHISDSPSPSTLFLSTRFSIISSASSSLSW